MILRLPVFTVIATHENYMIVRVIQTEGARALYLIGARIE